MLVVELWHVWAGNTTNSLHHLAIRAE
ncbi:hypothetical protein E2C01_059618 [Portunus trituberculatus]|uniref:Uncharacterized protein n=1 Tax=Portunus trituberculatus TaxID=210409 RepID=A0A5B7H5V3_PORTR|nr:hypothetical protein [Portunus trituberculatus]